MEILAYKRKKNIFFGQKQASIDGQQSDYINMYLKNVSIGTSTISMVLDSELTAKFVVFLSCMVWGVNPMCVIFTLYLPYINSCLCFSLQALSLPSEQGTAVQ